MKWHRALRRHMSQAYERWRLHVLVYIASAAQTFTIAVPASSYNPNRHNGFFLIRFRLTCRHQVKLMMVAVQRTIMQHQYAYLMPKQVPDVIYAIKDHRWSAETHSKMCQQLLSPRWELEPNCYV